MGSEDSMKRTALLLAVLIGLAAAGTFAYRPLRSAFAGTGRGAVSCDYDGKTYAPGADDGCNVCTCRENGWSCTAMFCPPGSGGSGTIAGSVSYPTKRVPAQRVCAVNLKDDREYCQQTVEGETSYALPVPAGDYWVYAMPIQTDAKTRAYYSEYERCGEKADCKDHSPITVSVASEQIAEADPKDWSAGGQIDDISVTPSKWEYGIHNYYPGSTVTLKSRNIATVKFFYTVWPPQDTPVAVPMGEAALVRTDHQIQTWSLAIPDGFEASSVYGLGTAQDGDFMKSRELRFVRPISTDSASSTVR